jgi:hypothetical protein
LSTALEVLREIEVPVKRQTPGESTSGANGEIEVAKLLVRVPLNLCQLVLLISNTDRV